MKWTTEKPTVPGWYWVRWKYVSYLSIGEVYVPVEGLLCITFNEGRSSSFLRDLSYAEAFSSEPIPFPTEN